MSEPADSKRALWRQPLVHFLLAGVAIFALNEARGISEPEGTNRIVVTSAQIERIAVLWQKTWGRPPSETQLRALVRDHIREEIYYREALKLGLDVNDTVIRRRLRQKMEFLTTSDTDLLEPDDATLQAFLEQNPDQYQLSPVFEFEQLYFANDDVRIEQALSALQSRASTEGLGDPISLPAVMKDANETAISRTFGTAFYRELDELATGAWLGPVISGFGRHLVRIDRKEPARMPELADVRARVENDWRSEQRRASLDASFEHLLGAYDVEIEVTER